MYSTKRSITKTFIKLFLLAIILFLFLFMIAAFWFAKSQKSTSKKYLDSSMTIMAQNMEEYFYNLEKVGFGISSNWSIISLHSNSISIDKTYAVENAYQMVSLLCSLNSSITDIMVVDIDGTARSYFAGVDYHIINDIPATNLFTDEYNFDRNFYFFPEDSNWSKNYFIYCVPIYNMWIGNTVPKKIATGVVLCNKSQLLQILKYDNSLPSEYYALYNDSQLVFSNVEEFQTGLSDAKTLKSNRSLTYDNLNIVGIYTQNFIRGSLSVFFVFGLFAFLFLIAILLLMAYYTTGCITKPIAATKKQLIDFNSGDLNKHIAPSNIKEIDEIIVDINYMIDEIRAVTKKIFLTQDTLYETELRKTEAELYALQSQVNPHFLYNTLQCICGLAALKRFQDILDVALSMSDVFKYSIEPGEFVTCIDEINIVYKYLSIYKIRYNGNLDYEIDVSDKILDCITLKMIIQPTVENAMLHAYLSTDKKPSLHILGSIEENNILFRIIDNGTGIPHDKLRLIQESLKQTFSDSINKQSSFGLGLYNINRRIKLVYGDPYGITLFSNKNGTEVDILIPFNKSSQDDLKS